MDDIEQKDAFPLCWPHNVPRVPAAKRERGRFRVTPGNARGFLVAELRALQAREVVISTNIPLRRDGLPYADGDPPDPAVAIYFKLNGKPHAMTCDRWESVSANMQAMALTIEAMRGISRWGSKEMTEQVFTGFQALPPSATDWRSVFKIAPGEKLALDTVKSIYRGMALRAHPDRGGDVNEMARLNEAMEAAAKELSA